MTCRRWTLSRRRKNTVPSSPAAQAWQAAFAADRPVVVEPYTDPEVPPLPPHITLKQAQAFASTLIKGDPREWRIIKETAKELVADLLPGRV
jgi:pyruvate dehydrogenase (quinone)